MSTRRGVGAKRADMAFSWARSGIGGEVCREGDGCEDAGCDAGGCDDCGCGEFSCAFCAEAKATAQSRSTIAGMSFRMR